MTQWESLDGAGDQWDQYVRELYGAVHLVTAVIGAHSMRGVTACGKAAVSPPADWGHGGRAGLGADVEHNMAVTNDADRVDCEDCLVQLKYCADRGTDWRTGKPPE